MLESGGSSELQTERKSLDIIPINVSVEELERLKELIVKKGEDFKHGVHKDNSIKLK
jgi:hypothetical protein